MSTVLVTGATGMVGTGVSGSLQAAGHTVFGCARTFDVKADSLKFTPQVCDLRAEEQVRSLLRACTPHVIVHLAAAQAGAVSSPPARDLYETNLTGTLNLLEAVRSEVPRARVIAVGSGAEYGPADSVYRRWTENDRLSPAAAYAASKAAASLAALAYAHARILDVTVVRLFNLLGPSRSVASAPAWFARQLAEMELGMREPVLTCGNPTAVRDFLDCRDAVSALCTLVERPGSHRLYNICRGRGVTLEQLIRRLIHHSRVASVTVSSTHKGTEPDRLVGNPQRFRNEMGLAPRVTLDRSTRDLLDHWRRMLRDGPV